MFAVPAKWDEVSPMFWCLIIIEVRMKANDLPACVEEAAFLVQDTAAVLSDSIKRVGFGCNRVGDSIRSLVTHAA